MRVLVAIDGSAPASLAVDLFARLGTSSRAEATSLAFRGLAAVGSR